MSALPIPAEIFEVAEYLRDELEERGWTISEFAEIIGRPIQTVSEILNGKKEITVDTAISIAAAFGTTPELWLNLQNNVKIYKARNSKKGEIRLVERRARLNGLIPVSKAKARGWLGDAVNIDQLEIATCQLLELRSLDEKPKFAIAARRSNSNEAITPEQIAWLAHVRFAASTTQSTSPFDLAALSTLASELPRRTSIGPTSLHQVPKWFAECGVTVVFSEGLTGGRLDGAVTFLANGRPIIALTTRGDRFDSLIFTLLHEIAHLTLLHINPDSQSIVDIDVIGDNSDPIEQAADAQAMKWLFPSGFDFELSSLQAIRRSAESLGLHPSLIFGQIQRRSGDWKRYRSHIPKVRPDLSEVGLMV